MKDIRSLLLVLLSVGLIATWVYHLYDKSNYSGHKSETVMEDPGIAAQRVRDSLQKVYLETIGNMDLMLDSTRNTSDSLQTQLVIKVKEVTRLKSEISKILKDPNATDSELLTARQKMKELEEIVRQLREQKDALESEKKELNTRLDQMSGEVYSLQQNIRRLDDENKNLTEKIKMASIFVSSALHFTAMHIQSEKEQETSQAKKADKFVASFVLQNNFNDYMNAEIMIVITEPDGRVLQSSTWDSGSFDTKSEGRKNYTRKMRFDYTKGEQKALIFTLDVEMFQKGTYTLQIWHNGIMIGEVAKALS